VVLFDCSYFVLTPVDLEEWALDPEAFHHEQDIVQWKEKLRPCAESLYLALFESHREVINQYACFHFMLLERLKISILKGSQLSTGTEISNSRRISL
jgi:hypothetical protein